MSGFIPSILRRSRQPKEKLPLTPVPPFPSPPKEENGIISVKNNYNPQPIHLPEEYKDLMHELETKQPPKEVPEQIFDEEITSSDYKQQCSIKESSKESTEKDRTRKVNEPPRSTEKKTPSKEPLEKNDTRRIRKPKCPMEKLPKNPLDIMREIETKKPPTELPEQIFESPRKVYNPQCSEESPSKEFLESPRKVYSPKCSEDSPSKESLDIIHGLETKPPTEVPEQIFDIIHEIETKQPPAEVPEQIFEGEGQWRNVHWRIIKKSP